MNPNLPLASVRTLEEIYDASMARTSFTLVMLAIAGGMALLLGVAGIYGVISYAVSQRRREIGIRIALGAPAAAITGLFVRHGVMLAGIGVAIGLAAAFGVTRLMSSLLFEVSPVDPLTYGVVSLTLFARGRAGLLPAGAARHARRPDRRAPGGVGRPGSRQGISNGRIALQGVTSHGRSQRRSGRRLASRGRSWRWSSSRMRTFSFRGKDACARCQARFRSKRAATGSGGWSDIVRDHGIDVVASHQVSQAGPVHGT